MLADFKSFGSSNPKNAPAFKNRSIPSSPENNEDRNNENRRKKTQLNFLSVNSSVFKNVLGMPEIFLKLGSLMQQGHNPGQPTGDGHLSE